MESETRDTILLCAADEFSERGLAGARMQSIADRAGINKAMLHYYFRDKTTLYEESLRYFMTVAARRLTAIGEQCEDRSSFLNSIVTDYFAFLSEKPGLIRIVVGEIVSGAPHLKNIFLSLDDRIRKNLMRLFLSERVALLQKRREIRSDLEASHIILSILGVMAAAFLQEILIGNLYDMSSSRRKRFLEKRRRAIVRIFERGLSAI
jgi:AcrR family transcriptional regulator